MAEFNDFKVGNIGLAEDGRAAILKAQKNLPKLMSLRHKYVVSKPLQSARLAVCLHVTSSTVVLVETLEQLGAETLQFAGDRSLNLILDDGCCLFSEIRKKHPDLLPVIRGVSEGSVYGASRLRKLHKKGSLQVAAFAINDYCAAFIEDKWFCGHVLALVELWTKPDHYGAGIHCLPENLQEDEGGADDQPPALGHSSSDYLLAESEREAAPSAASSTAATDEEASENTAVEASEITADVADAETDDASVADLQRDRSDMMDEFKRQYSNTFEPVTALPYFWQHYDSGKYSIWSCVYLYNASLTNLRVSSDALSGLFIGFTSGEMRKHAFGTVCLFSGDHGFLIRGLWIVRGESAHVVLAEECAMDYDSFEWTRLNGDKEETKQLVEQFVSRKGTFEGKAFRAFNVYK